MMTLSRVWFLDWGGDFRVRALPREGWLAWLGDGPGYWTVLTEDGTLHRLDGPIGDRKRLPDVYDSLAAARAAAVTTLRRQLESLPESRARAVEHFDEEERAARHALAMLEVAE
jgi:hypothetical protein